MLLSLIIPCYNEGDNIIPFYNLVKDTFKNANVNYDYEFVFINDGSRDNTISNLKNLYKEYKNDKITVVNFSRNFGKEAAMYAGLEKSKGDFVGIIDADLQQHPKYILKMMDILLNDEDGDLDCVAAYQKQRREGKGLSFFKKSFYKIITKTSNMEVAPDASDFRVMNRKMVNALLDMPEYFRFSKGLFAWVGFNSKFIPYEVSDRHSGETKWSLWKLLKYGIGGIISFTTAPLKLSIGLGLIMAIIALIYTIVVFCQRVFGGVDVPGYATLAILILVLGGVQLITIGILGEYLSRVYIEGKNRPIYIAKDVLSYDDEK